MALLHALTLSILLGLTLAADSGLPCAKKQYNKGIACVCNSTYCDTVKPLKKLALNTIYSYTSSEEGQRLDLKSHSFTVFPQNTDATFNVDHSKEYQEIYGIGGAMTDAAGINIHSLSPGARNNFFNSYFSEDGIEYSIVRVPIAGCDYSTRPYTYSDGTKDLSSFQLSEEDYSYKIPYIKEAQKRSPGPIRLFGSAWEAPDWMRGINGMYKSAVTPEFYQAWAEYHKKFLDAYAKAGVPLWGLTTGNEPTASIVSMNWLELEQQKWINNHLGPLLNSSGYGDTKLFICDDQTPYVPIWQGLLRDPVTSSYVTGLGTHWYLDTMIPLIHMGFNMEFPNKAILSTEACICEYEEFFAEETSWERAERYADNIAVKLSNWVNGWVDWNMALDMIGGPNYVLNYCDAPVRVNAAADEFYKQPMFYAMAHFSKFVPPGSRKIDLDYSPKKELTAVAFKTPTNRIVVVILNKNNKDYTASVCKNKLQCAKINVQKRSIVTLVTSSSIL